MKGLLSIALVWLIAGFCSGAVGEELTWGNYQRWRDYVAVKPHELAWEKIAWRNNFWDAAIEANDKDMPVLLWTMNGHPLGCT